MPWNTGRVSRLISNPSARSMRDPLDLNHRSASAVAGSDCEIIGTDTHIWGAELVKHSALSRKKGGTDRVFPAAIHCAPAGHSPKS